MSMTDPIADLLTRIRNARMAKHADLEVPSSKMKAKIVEILKQEGYIDGFELSEEGFRHVIRIRLKYSKAGENAITGLQRVSTPGRRVYCGKDEIPRVLGGLGITILSTSKGIMTGSSCREHGVGGEVLCNIW